MKRLRVLVLVHEDLVPPESIRGVPPQEKARWKVEWDVISTLKKMGHHVRVVGIYDELLPIREAVKEFDPHIAFNLMEEFHGDALFDQHVVSYLELLRLPYTGCNPRGLTLARDKALAKKILTYHRIPVPQFAVFQQGRRIRRPKRLEFPLIVKSLVEEASYGISQASVVDTDAKLRERVEFIFDRVGTDAIVEQYVSGRELYVGLLGTRRLEVLPTWELIFRKMDNSEPIATARVKWDKAYQKRHGITSRAAKLPVDQEKAIGRVSKRIYRALGLSGYARLDYRLSDAGVPYLLEANPNPNLDADDDLADAAKAAGIPYTKLLQRILSVGLRDSVARGRR